ncbi:hypothetical protein [Ornithinicoccus hortensis]|uniref:Cell division protein FtsL n=1 Tax=Ornithinicoccus hortensis TaxID=82346 RepID=A0A542YQZ2_9MICO|nr:hypothetical protein [Ornithinicoccus hortensis]TQL50532.1 hypothetical protein FB467_1643 [Ornithinicoccus hortensis]
MSQMTAARAPRGAVRASRAGAARPAPGNRQTTQRPRLRIVDAAPRRQGNTGFALLCIALVLGGLMAALMLNMARGEGAFTLGALTAEQTRLHDERVTLEAELSVLSSPETIAKEADKLGMVPSPSTAVLRLSDGAVLGVAAGVDGNQTFTVVTSSTTDETTSGSDAEEGAGSGTTDESSGDADKEG